MIGGAGGWERGEGEEGRGGLACSLPEQFQPVGVWQSLKEVGKAASFTGRAMMSNMTGSSSQQKQSQSVQPPPHCRGGEASPSTMTSQLNSAAAAAARGSPQRGDVGTRAAGRGGSSASRGPRPAAAQEEAAQPGHGEPGRDGSAVRRAGLSRPGGAAAIGSGRAAGALRALRSRAAAARSPALPPASLWRW